MIRLSLGLLLCIGVTMAVVGRDVERPMGSDDPDFNRVATAAEPAETARLALDDERGAIERALAATIAPEPEPEEAAMIQTASLQPMLPQQDLHVVTGNRVNVRSGPSTANQVVDQVVRDQRVEVLSETPDGWMRIFIPDSGIEAYIFGRFLQPEQG
ncbi:SH3 domain-containing protein [Palleronia salina]|nr:SH3 domain-containing protein [Palleronia salina]